jgi:DNA-binding transcriptional LysR family regulator
MHKLDWNDLQLVLAVADGGSLAAAARALGVNHTTVLRRVGAFEGRLGVRLFERLPTGYALTAAGEELSRAAREIQETVAGVERSLMGRDLRLSGAVRVTTTDTLAASVLPAALAGFAARHPGVQLELTTAAALANLSKRDADVAVRPTKKPPGHLYGRRICRVAFAVYASPAYLERMPAKRGLSEHDWLMPDDTLASTSVARWIAAELKGKRPALRADTFTSLAHAAAAGLGVVALPCYLGDTRRGLRRVGGAVPAMAMELWILTHEDLRGTARVRALTEWLADALARERGLFEGRRPLR